MKNQEQELKDPGCAEIGSARARLFYINAWIDSMEPQVKALWDIQFLKKQVDILEDCLEKLYETNTDLWASSRHINNEWNEIFGGRSRSPKPKEYNTKLRIIK